MSENVELECPHIKSRDVCSFCDLNDKVCLLDAKLECEVLDNLREVV